MKLILSFIFIFNIAWAKEVKLTILHTNDHHGRFFRNKHGEYGLAARKTLIDQLRDKAKKENRHVLLLSGGDINTGIPESDMLEAEPDFKGMKMLGYDAMAVGNHEFDNELRVIHKQESWAGFPFLSANIFYKKPIGGFLGFWQKKRPFKPFIIKKFKNLKVGIIGFTTTDTPQKVRPDHLENVLFKSPVNVAKKLIPKLQKKTDLIVAVTHMGHFENGRHGIEAPGDVTLAREVSGIDVIVGGHTQKALFKPDIQNGTFIVQAHEWGKFVGKLDLIWDGKKLKLEDYQLIPVNLKKKVKTKKGKTVRTFLTKEISEDTEVLRFLEPFQKKGAEKLNIVIGQTKVLLNGERPVTTTRDTYLTRLINLSLKEGLKTDISVMNSGGIRANIEEGQITYRDLLTVMPFGGTIATVKLSGSELKTYLRNLIFTQPKTSNGFPHFEGVQFAVREGDLSGVTINGKKLRLKEKYTLSLPVFLAKGGDKYPRLDTHPSFNDSGLVDALILKNYIEKNKVLTKELLK